MVSGWAAEMIPVITGRHGSVGTAVRNTRRNSGGDCSPIPTAVRHTKKLCHTTNNKQQLCGKIVTLFLQGARARTPLYASAQKIRRCCYTWHMGKQTKPSSETQHRKIEDENHARARTRVSFTYLQHLPSQHSHPRRGTRCPRRHPSFSNLPLRRFSFAASSSASVGATATATVPEKGAHGQEYREHCAADAQPSTSQSSCCLLSFRVSKPQRGDRSLPSPEINTPGRRASPARYRRLRVPKRQERRHSRVTRSRTPPASPLLLLWRRRHPRPLLLPEHPLPMPAMLIAAAIASSV